MTPQIRTYITKTKAGHYCLTVKAMKPWGVMGTVCRYNHRFIDNLTEARHLAAMAKAELLAGAPVCDHR